MTWNDDQEYERAWWSDGNNYAESTKQLTYLHRMRLVNTPTNGKWPVYDMNGASVIDIGGGPESVLLRMVNASRRVVADPCHYADWVYARYEHCGIESLRTPGEDLDMMPGPRPLFDLAIGMNVLQHVASEAAAERIVRNARHLAREVRWFDWIDMPLSPGHSVSPTQELLESWFGATGTTEWMDENGCHGRAWYAVMPQ